MPAPPATTTNQPRRKAATAISWEERLQDLKVTVGFSPLSLPVDKQADAITKNLLELNKYRTFIYDLHFPHYNPHICASGRPMNATISPEKARELTLNMISWNRENTQFKLTLLLNYLLHDHYQVVVDNVAEEFYPRGVRSVVVADLELIKRLKDRLPDLEIQGSCLSNRMTLEELEEERREGVVLHNPSVNIIRNPEQLKANAEAGYAQKVIAFEGCLHHCPDENSKFGHRWYLARSLLDKSFFCAQMEIATDPRYFFKANWVTVQYFKKLMPFVEVVKLPRTRTSSALSLAKLIAAFQHDSSYNVVEFLGAGYLAYLARDVGQIPSHLFDEHFFETVTHCKMDCQERQCNLCFEIMNRIKYFSYKQKRLAKLANRRAGDRRWNFDNRWRDLSHIL